MKKSALTSLFSLGTFLVASTASAQPCPPGSWLCANLQIGGGVSVTPPPPPPPPPPQPPVVIVQAEPVYVPPPQTYVVTSTPTVTYQNTYRVWGLGTDNNFGIGAFASGISLGSRDHSSSLLGGVAVARFRYHPYFATELTLGLYGGTDYNGDTRAEVPLTVSEMVYFNPMHRLQVYGLLGIGSSWATVNYANPTARGRDTGSYTYIGGQVGLGLEWHITRRFALFTDVRGFLRTRVDSETDTNPEFTRTLGARTETSNSSLGVVGNIGAMFYF